MIFKKNDVTLFDESLKKAARENRSRFLILWNRGLGDIPLGLYALIVRIRNFIPYAEITFLTRPDLADCFRMLEGVRVLVAPSVKRGEKRSLQDLLREVGREESDFDYVLDKADLTRSLSWQVGHLIPRLEWREEWDSLAGNFSVPKGAIGAHIQSETSHYYGYKKDWPFDYWQKLIRSLPNQMFVLFGFDSTLTVDEKNVIDLRGKTTLFEMLSLIKNRCHTLIAPDSGVLSLIYYVAADFPLQVISLWADPRQGVLRQKVPSPNASLIHFPLIGNREKVSNVPVELVKKAVENGLSRLSSTHRASDS